MTRLAFAALGGSLLLSGAAPPPADVAPPLSMWRLDCGQIKDERASPWTDGSIPVSCYLIRHGRDYVLFDTGLSAARVGAADPDARLNRTIVDQLKELKVDPARVKFLVVSHYHGDHTGQARQFPKATLIMGAADIAAMKEHDQPIGSSAEHLRPWLDGKAPLRAINEDEDIFGDGSVVVLMTRGHTPGHTSLLVKLKGRPVVLSGDLWLGHEEAITGDVPSFNTSFGETAGSRDRVGRIVLQNDALLVIGHDMRDIAALPPFPKPAQ